MYQAASSPINKSLPALDLAFVPPSYAVALRLPIRGWPGIAKRWLDIAIALFGLLVFSLPMLAIALAIALESPGPIVFRQRRIGLGNVDFEMWKFRTMHDHPPECGRLTQTRRNDPRLTR